MSGTLTASNLNERVYGELRTRVLTRQEPAGAKLSLHVLASELGVSRSPVHHALTRLVSEGLLTVQPRRGYYVAPVTARGVAEGYDVRLALELLAAEQAIPRLDGALVAGFEQALEATDAAISDEQWDAANAAFHEYQIDLAQNALLSRFYRRLRYTTSGRPSRRPVPLRPRHPARDSRIRRRAAPPRRTPAGPPAAAGRRGG